MFDPSSFGNPTPLAHADASRDVLPRGEVCMNAVVNESVKIGGVNVIVEKFGKMKYGKGKPVDGKWVFGGIERGTNRFSSG
ncbi:hypothetical protein TNCV_1636351 [Trichonephila clavipes]|uniref:Uncharacterized protein n=1 Tax=Trichonephila clavipes TaxID=2585209 RepID=A0A8X6V521_TRICX|nr:hypothetical protein TNCV_1636351 [Trichonephila clavipes]